MDCGASFSHDFAGCEYMYMGESIMSDLEKEVGLLSGFFKNTPLAGLGVLPKLEQKELTIELSEQQFKDLVFSGMKPEDKARAMQCIDVKIEQGKIIIKVRLF
jgi:hypothetical protein